MLRVQLDIMEVVLDGAPPAHVMVTFQKKNSEAWLQGALQVSTGKMKNNGGGFVAYYADVEYWYLTPDTIIESNKVYGNY